MPPRPHRTPRRRARSLDRYCVSCHNQRLKTAGLSLDTVDPASLAEHAEIWEKVVRKLRAGTMPPVGRPRPDKPAVGGADLRRSKPGSIAPRRRSRTPAVPPLHRLNRTEYANAIRDLLALDVDVRALLPADDTDEHGFDNIADVLSRLAGADGALPVRGAQDQPAGGRLPDRSGRRSCITLPRMLDAGRSAQRGPAVRIARRRRGAPLLPGRRRVHDQGQAASRTSTTTSAAWAGRSSSTSARWRAREALHGRRATGSEAAAAELRGRDARQHRPARPTRMMPTRASK